VCINRSASAWGLLRKAYAFSLNILGTDYAALSDLLAGRTEVSCGDARFAFAERRWCEHPMGSPVLEGALATHGSYQGVAPRP
jgi:flavin reductase (DIM6/NTAB) family NADH-FMN oxidoreductase RutF